MQWIIPQTKEVEVQYLLHRLDLDTESAFFANFYTPVKDVHIAQPSKNGTNGTNGAALHTETQFIAK